MSEPATAHRRDPVRPRRRADRARRRRADARVVPAPDEHRRDVAPLAAIRRRPPLRIRRHDPRRRSPTTIVREFRLPVDADDVPRARSRTGRAPCFPAPSPCSPSFRRATASRACRTPTSFHWAARSSATGRSTRTSTTIFRRTRSARSSPTPSISLHVIEALGVPAERVLFVDDNRAQRRAAARLGIVARGSRRSTARAGCSTSCAARGPHRPTASNTRRRGPAAVALALPAPGAPRDEPPSHAAAARRRRPAAARRPDRRRQVRLDVPGAGAAHAGHPRRRRSPTSRPRARARRSRASAGRPSDARARSFAAAQATARRIVTDDALALIAAPGVEIVIDATGNPAAGIRHVLACCAHGKHVVMVNVEADALAGPLLAQRAREAGIVYSLAYGDQPALICEMVDWAAPRASRWSPPARAPSTCPPTTRRRPTRCGRTTASRRRWSRPATSTRRCSTRSSTAPRARSRWRRSPTRPASRRRPDGLAFPPCGVDDLPRVLRPRDEGGHLAPRRPGRGDLQRRARRPAGVPRPALGRLRDVPRGRRTARLRAPLLQRIRLLDRPDGPLRGDVQAVPPDRARARHQRRVGRAARASRPAQPTAWHGDVVATAKRDLAAGETLDGEGGYTVYGKLMPAARFAARWAACRSGSRTA